MYKISKDFNLCYGHRVHLQEVNSAFTHNKSSACKCRHLHGHEGLVTVHLESEYVDNRGMVVDFLELGWLKNFIDDALDHKFIIDRNDPMFNALVLDLYIDRITLSPVQVEDVGTVGYAVNTAGVTSGTPLYEVLEGYFVVNFVPTSENLSKWLFDIVTAKMMPFKVKVSCVEWHETPKSCARYYG